MSSMQLTPTGQYAPVTPHVAIRVAWVLALAALVLAVAAACAAGSSPVVFTSDRDGNLELYAVDADSGVEKNITESPVDEFGARVSPDRSRVAFLARSGDSVAVEVIDVEGTERQVVTNGAGKHWTQRWSPRDDRLAYVREANGWRNIYVANSDGTEPMLLTSITADEVGSWSPDGRSVVFAVLDGVGRGLYIRNPDGVNEFRLTDTPDHSPIWSPDSKRIAYLSDRDGNPEVYVMDAAGVDQRRLTGERGGRVRPFLVSRRKATAVCLGAGRPARDLLGPCRWRRSDAADPQRGKRRRARLVAER